MLIIKNIKYGLRNYNDELKLCKLLLQASKVDDKAIIKFYHKFPDKCRGELISSKEINLKELNDIKISNYVNFGEYNLNDLIIEFEFILNINNKNISGYLRVNNENLRKNYGDIEMDIYPFDKISNFGDLIKEYGLEEIKDNIEKVIIKHSREIGIIVKESYISVSFGEPSVDLSKRIWIYYSQPFFLIYDLINFIKNFKELELEEGFNVPKYLIPHYEKILHKIRPYSVDFLSREFMGSKKFVEKFDSMVLEKQIEVKKGSLILSSNNLENNFLLARDLSEKMIFPVMEKVTGDKEFRDILNESI